LKAQQVTARIRVRPPAVPFFVPVFRTSGSGRRLTAVGIAFPLTSRPSTHGTALPAAFNFSILMKLPPTLPLAPDDLAHRLARAAKALAPFVAARPVPSRRVHAVPRTLGRAQVRLSRPAQA